jgi:hypothetical protein
MMTLKPYAWPGHASLLVLVACMQVSDPGNNHQGNDNMLMACMTHQLSNYYFIHAACMHAQQQSKTDA